MGDDVAERGGESWSYLFVGAAQQMAAKGQRENGTRYLYAALVELARLLERNEEDLAEVEEVSVILELCFDPQRT
jgi:hypothetical protein